MKYSFSELNKDNEMTTESRHDERRTNDNGRQHKNNSVLTRIDFGKFSESTNFGALRRGDKSKRNAAEEKKEVKPSIQSTLELEKTMLEEFITKYTDNKTNVQVLYALLQSDFVFVADVLANKYLNKKYEEVIPTMNAVIKLMTTKVFSTALLSVIKDEAFELNEVKVNFGKAISLVLRTSHGKMVESTISNYVEIMADHLFNVELKELQELGVTDEVATDLIIGIPTMMSSMTEAELKYSVGEFLGVLMEHVDTTIDTMDAEAQKKLFYEIFPSTNNQTLKAVGKCFTANKFDFGKDEKRAKLYAEYIKMLYMILDEHDIQDIEYVLKFIVKTVNSQPDDNKAAVVFNGEEASEYKNIKKALADYLSKNQNAKDVLF